MEGPLWTETHAPTLDELPQPAAREALQRTVEEPMNLLVQGPRGVGKTTAVRALAQRTHDDPDTDLIEINVADFFQRSKREIRDDPRFASFLTGRSRMAKGAMINRVLKESAGYAPVSGSFKTILLDNAEDIREDFQQALRRVMEQHHRTTQFVITTRQPTKLIPPIRSRCFPVRLRSPTTDETMSVLRNICEAEDVTYEDDGLEFVASASGGNLRKAILSAQATAVDEGELTMQAAYETLGDVGDDETLREALAAAADGDLSTARSTIDDLLDESYDGPELLRELLRVARAGSNYTGDELIRLHRLAGDVDQDLADGLDDLIHLTHLLAAWHQGKTTTNPPPIGSDPHT